MQDSFIFYRSFYEALKDLPDDLYKEITIAVMEYGLDGVEPNLSPMAKCAFLLIKPQIDANNRRRENGNKGGRPKTKTEELAEEQAETVTERVPKETEPKPNHNQTVTEPKPTETKPEHNVNVNVNDNDNLHDIHKALDTSTAEPEAAAPALADCEAIPLNDGTEWKPTVDLLAEWERLYPGVNVKQKIAEMRGWCLSKPEKRKTKKGVKVFVTNWLGREQNRAPAKPPEKKRTRFDNFEGHGTDYDKLMWQIATGGAK